MRLNYFTTLFLSLIIFSISNFVFAQSETVVARFGKYYITLDEFEYAYAKNVGGWENAVDDSISDYEDFMDLYIKFKMKLRDAKVRAYDRDEDLEKELRDYQKSVGVSYIEEKEIVEPGIEKLYNRRKEEMRVSHIMFRPDSTGFEGPLKKAQSILDSILNGADYEEMAKKYSQDKFSAPSGGDIYYVTAGILPAEFEDAMYNTPVGGVYPKPVKTRYGYHIIKVKERGPRAPKIKASHILVNYFDDEGEVDTAFAKATIDSIAALLKEGADFEELVRKYSDDTGTANKGGDLGYFERRMMVREFDETAFKMNVGDISDPIQTNFGFHIIKLTDKLDYPSFENQKEELKEMYKKQRYDDDLKTLAESLKEKYNYKVNESTVGYFISKSDSVRFGMVHPHLDEISDEVIFTYSDKAVTVGTFLEKLSNNSSFTARPMYVRKEVDKAIDKVSQDLILEEEAMNLDKTNPEFAALMDDYRNGIYIFKIQEEEVWDKVKFDSTAVYEYWQKNKEKYKWPDRVAFSEIFSTKDSLINLYYQKLQEGAAFDSIAALYTERPNKRKVKGYYPLEDVNFSDLTAEANKIENIGDYTKPFPLSGGYAIFKLEDRQPARLKTFEEAKAEVSGEYQEMLSKKLEEEYIQRLEERYNPVIYYDELANAFKNRED